MSRPVSASAVLYPLELRPRGKDTLKSFIRNRKKTTSTLGFVKALARIGRSELGYKTLT